MTIQSAHLSRQQNPRAAFFHNNMTIPLIKDTAVLGVIAIIAKSIFGMDRKIVGAILLIGFVASVVRHLINYGRMDLIRKENLMGPKRDPFSA